MKTDIFAIQSTCMEVSVSLSCLFVHEPPYQTTVVCCNAIFRRGSSRMNHRTVFHVRVGLAQALPNQGYPTSASGQWNCAFDVITDFKGFNFAFCSMASYDCI